MLLVKSREFGEVSASLWDAGADLGHRRSLKPQSSRRFTQSTRREHIDERINGLCGAWERIHDIAKRRRVGEQAGRALESTSVAKKKAARANGKLGGRPRKVVTKIF